jgi:MoaA/NifB/PqqE/SkfB family radical SAM enzyme
MEKSFCHAPDTGLHVYTNGDVKVCCAGTYAFGNIRKQSIIEIFSSEKYKAFKQSPDTYCQGCVDFAKIDPNGGLRAMFHNYPSPGFDQTKVIDIRWNNVCNLSCRYCNPTDSSEWAKLLHIPIETVNRDYVESLFQHVIAHKDTIECAMLLGGEPLMQKHNERLLTILDTKTKIDIITNLSVDLSKNKIYQALKNFQNITWSISMENVGEQLEYIRHGSSWDLMVKNIDTLIQDFGSIKIGLLPIYHMWSALHVKDLVDFAASKGLRTNWQLGFQPFGTPYSTDSFLVAGHSKAIVDRAIAEIDKIQNPDSFLSGVRDALRANIPVPGKSEKLLKWIANMEAVMPPTKPFAELWPELNTLLQQNTLP